MEVPVVAGSIATVVFASSALPMLLKAWRTKDVSSYSLANIALSNLGNVFYTAYVLHLPPGPVWALHSFYTLSTGLMLFWYLRYGVRAPSTAIAGRSVRGARPAPDRSSWTRLRSSR